MRLALFLLCVVVGGCAATRTSVQQPDRGTLRDIESYAIASCLWNQRNAFLQDQGDAWASVIIQRAKINIESLTNIAAQVKTETEKGEIAVIRDEIGPNKDKSLPVLYCYEIIDKPTVRAAIQKVADSIQ
jgi:hypothetical protein